MVTRYRLRSALFNIALWLLAAGVVTYFGYHAVHGQRGLEAQHKFEIKIAALKGDLSRLEQQRTELEAKVTQLRPESVDRDILDEEARTQLGWLNPNDRVLNVGSH
jgi:cell division protein FtsB